MGRSSVNRRVYVWRIMCEDPYFVYSMDVPGYDPEDALARCERVLKMDYPDTVHIVGQPDKISTRRSYCGGILWYLVPVMDKDEMDDSVL